MCVCVCAAAVSDAGEVKPGEDWSFLAALGRRRKLLRRGGDDSSNYVDAVVAKGQHSDGEYKVEEGVRGSEHKSDVVGVAAGSVDSAHGSYEAVEPVAEGQQDQRRHQAEEEQRHRQPVHVLACVRACVRACACIRKKRKAALRMRA